jgi:hypothetical protein
MDLVLVFIDFNYVKYITDFHLSFISYNINMIAIILILCFQTLYYMVSCIVTFK